MVVDAWQGRGVGRAMLRELCRQARSRGVSTLTASILFENRRAIRLMQSLGALRSGACTGGLVQYTASLGPAPAVSPSEDGARR
jgi:L-amino acid N-acyltransferase YncA